MQQHRFSHREIEVTGRSLHRRTASTVWVWARSLDDEYIGEPILDFPGIANRPLADVKDVALFRTTGDGPGVVL